MLLNSLFLCAVLALAYSPDGSRLAVATLNGHISIMDVQSEEITQTIEGRHDLGYSRRETDKITAKKSADGKLVILGNIYSLVVDVSVVMCHVNVKFRV